MQVREPGRASPREGLAAHAPEGTGHPRNPDEPEAATPPWDAEWSPAEAGRNAPSRGEARPGDQAPCAR